MFSHPAFGLDISDRSLKAVLLSGRGAPKLSGMAYSELPEGIVENGKIHNPSLLAETIRMLMREYVRFGDIPTTRVITSIPEAETYVHAFSVPREQKTEDMAAFLEKEAAAIIPLPSGERASDFRISAEGADLQEVLYVASPRSIVEQMHRALADAGLEPIALEPELEALARSMNASYNGTGAYLLLDIGARSADIGVVERGHVQFSSSVRRGGNHFTEAISQSLHVSEDQAEALKRSCGLLPEAEEGKVMLVIQKELQEMLEEVRRVRSFYQKRAAAPIDMIILAGGSSLMPGLAEYLAENMGIPARIGDPWTSIDVSLFLSEKGAHEALEIEPVLYAASVGSALRGLAGNPEREGYNLFRNIHFQKGRVSGFLGRFFGKS